MAKFDLSNKIITNPKELKHVYVNHFQHRMRKRPLIPKFEEYNRDIENKFSNILKITKVNKFPDWSKQDLEKVLKSLKRSQSQDTMGVINELFMMEHIGDDLKISLLQLFNKIKNTNQIPNFFRKVYVTAIPKGKKSPVHLVNQRGIFLVPKLRGLFLKLIYNSIIDTIEDSLSLSNIGARPHKSPRDHLFVLHSVMDETLRGKEVCLDLVFYDLAKVYDSLRVEHTLLDLYENKVDTNLLNVLYELSKKTSISIKTPVGISEEKEIDDTIMQGENVSSILCTSTVDKIAKDSPFENFKYKEKVDIPKLGFVDDLCDVNRCGSETKEVNRYTVEQINKRGLQFSEDKCVRMHVKSKSKPRKEECEKLEIEGWKVEKYKENSVIKQKDVYTGKVELKTVTSHTYLGSVIESNGSNKLNIQSRVSKGQAVIRDIFQILEGSFFGSFYFDVVKLLRESMLISVITHN